MAAQQSAALLCLATSAIVKVEAEVADALADAGADVDAGAEDVSDLGDTFEVVSEATDLVAVRTAVTEAGGKVLLRRLVASGETVNLTGNDLDAAGGKLIITKINGVPVKEGSHVILPSGLEIVVNADGSFTIGAATSGAQIGEHEALCKAYPGVVEGTVAVVLASGAAGGVAVAAGSPVTGMPSLHLTVSKVLVPSELVMTHAGSAPAVGSAVCARADGANAITESKAVVIKSLVIVSSFRFKFAIVRKLPPVTVSQVRQSADGDCVSM